MNELSRLGSRINQLGHKGWGLLHPVKPPQVLVDMIALAMTLKEKQVSTVLLVVSREVNQRGLHERLEQMLMSERIGCVRMVPITRDEQAVTDLHAAYLSGQCQGIIAMGGRLVMDCAKAVAARLNKTVLMAVPTVAATGCEATGFAALTTSDGAYRRVVTPAPSHVLLDSTLTHTVPADVTVLCTLSTIVRAIEALLSRGADKDVREMALESITLASRYLQHAVNDGSDAPARKSLMEAAWCAGQACAKVGEGYAQTLAHGLHSQYGMPFGAACAAILSELLPLYGRSGRKALANAARLCGASPVDASDAEASAAFGPWLKEWMTSFDLPTYLPQLRRRDIHRIATLSEAACNPRYAAPRVLERSQLMLLLERLLPAPEVPCQDAEQLVTLQRSFFDGGQTRSVLYRRDALIRLRDAIRSHEQDIGSALQADLGKSGTESYMCEIGMVLSELSWMLRHFKGATSAKPVLSPLPQFSSWSYTVRNPYGVTLIMSPWNYPFLLTMAPLVGAMAAGNCCVIKPSAHAPATSAIIRQLCQECFPQEYVAVVEGGRVENQLLLDQAFDKIFFTGSAKVGREVLMRAAEQMIPVTLELGGKSPVVVDHTAKLELAARRIAFGKLLNAGQTCVAPDYILVERSVRDELVEHLRSAFADMVGEDALINEDYVHMINRRHYDRVMGLIVPEKVVFGGQGDEQTLRIQPTILDNTAAEDPAMQEEIFGPVLPVIAVDSVDEAVAFINARPHPLACYLFSQDSAVQARFHQSVPFGGGCINDTIIHLATNRMGFGGVGESGMGSYRGQKSIEAFSHQKSMVHKHCWIDLPFRYMPYSGLKEKLVRFFLR